MTHEQRPPEHHPFYEPAEFLDASPEAAIPEREVFDFGFIDANKDKPFFLMFPTHDPHVPRVPHPRFAGATQLGPRGDAIAHVGRGDVELEPGRVADAFGAAGADARLRVAAGS